jgi:phage terminase large subunit
MRYSDISEQENITNDLVKADSAEPKSISELNQYGLRVTGVKKGPDSIEYGIKFLQDLEEIVIDDMRCPETAREFLTYELEKDANGNFKAKFPDRNNHSIDMTRYALNDEIINHKQEQKNKAKNNAHWMFQTETKEEGYISW